MCLKRAVNSLYPFELLFFCDFAWKLFVQKLMTSTAHNLDLRDTITFCLMILRYVVSYTSSYSCRAPLVLCSGTTSRSASANRSQHQRPPCCCRPKEKRPHQSEEDTPRANHPSLHWQTVTGLSHSSVKNTLNFYDPGPKLRANACTCGFGFLQGGTPPRVNLGKGGLNP